MLLMFQRAETTERKAKDNRQEVVRKSDKKTPQLRGGKIYFITELVWITPCNFIFIAIGFDITPTISKLFFHLLQNKTCI